ncbi:MAG: ComEC/Rec2 family competence protein [Patescibacteria group bacterium]|nr:ComEC/Rec2 family competence protein [Patescibacteria group bacterium]
MAALFSPPGHRFKRSTLYLCLFLSILVGIGVAHWGYVVPGIWCLLLGVLAVVACVHRSFMVIVAAVLFGLSCGLWRGAAYAHRLQAYDALFYRQITVTAVASEDATYGKTKQLTFAAHNITLENGIILPGKMLVSGYGVNAVFQNDVISISGKMYPSRSANQARMSFANLSVLEEHPTLIASFRRKFIVGTQNALPEPLAPFVMGLLIGQRATLPDNIKTDLQKVGLTHIIAVSGYNLTIILQASKKVFGKRSKRISTLLSVLLIGVFLLIAGNSASIVRAAIVSLLSIAAGYYGRAFKPCNLLALAAVITAWANPAYIWSDLSWYLSFLAFYGVMVLGPLIQARWPGKWHDSLIMSIALESLCAELLTLPFILFIFGQMSKIGLLANVLVVSLVPLAMLLGAIAGLAGMYLGSIAGWFAWPAVLMLNYMLDTAHILASVPGVFINGIGFPLPALITSYVIIIMLTIVLMHKTRGQKPATITDRNEPKYRGMLA